MRATKTPQQITVEVLEEWLQERADDMRNRLTKHGISPQNSPLSQGIAPTGVVLNDGGFTATIELDDYFEFIDQGVKGIGKAAHDSEGLRKATGKFKFKTPFVNRAMVEKIRDWGARRGRTGVTKVNMNSVAYLTAKKVKRLGIKQTLFFTEATAEKFTEQLSQRLLEELGQSFEVSVLID